ncbi:MAG TPA: hypothetical protein VKN63_11575 [Afifellaceae bacterium]|nr:hypothetical protein [Afifellaceae bacterium]
MKLVLPYGTVSVPSHVEAALDSGQAAEISHPGAPVIEVDCSRCATLRLSDVSHPFTLPPEAQDLAHAESQLTVLEHHLVKLCGVWAKPQARFVANYFSALRGYVGENQAALEARAGQLAGLVEPLHWCFAAPMPLPRAHIGLDEKGNLSNAGHIVRTRVDFAFWSDGGLSVMEIGTGNQTGGRRRALEALADAGVRVDRIDPALDGQALLARLGPGFTAFTDGLDLPESPFHGRGLPVPA